MHKIAQLHRIPQALIWNPIDYCNAVCGPCGALHTFSYREYARINHPEEISFEDVRDVTEYFMMMELFGPQGIQVVRFAGDFAEPSGVEDLPLIIPYLIKTLPRTKIEPFTNMTCAPAEDYNSAAMHAYFLKVYGLSSWPGNFHLTISVDNFHLAGLSTALQIPLARFRKSYLAQIQNLSCFAQENSQEANLLFQAVIPPGRTAADVEATVRREFGITSQFRFDTLMQAVYAPRMARMRKDAVRLTGNQKPGVMDVPDIAFVGMRGREVVVFDNLADLGDRNNGLPYTEWALDIAFGERRMTLADYTEEMQPGDAYAVIDLYGKRIQQISAITGNKPCSHYPGAKHGRILPSQRDITQDTIRFLLEGRVEVDLHSRLCPCFDNPTMPVQRLISLNDAEETEQPALIDPITKSLFVGDQKVDIWALERDLVPFPSPLTIL